MMSPIVLISNLCHWIKLNWKIFKGFLERSCSFLKKQAMEFREFQELTRRHVVLWQLMEFPTKSLNMPCLNRGKNSTSSQLFLKFHKIEKLVRNFFDQSWLCPKKLRIPNWHDRNFLYFSKSFSGVATWVSRLQPGCGSIPFDRFISLFVAETWLIKTTSRDHQFARKIQIVLSWKSSLRLTRRWIQASRQIELLLKITQVVRMQDHRLKCCRIRSDQMLSRTTKPPTVAASAWTHRTSIL